MTAAAALINGLQGERDRWTEQSKEFRAQIGRSVTSNFRFQSYHLLNKPLQVSRLKGFKLLISSYFWWVILFLTIN